MAETDKPKILKLGVEGWAFVALVLILTTLFSALETQSNYEQQALDNSARHHRAAQDQKWTNCLPLSGIVKQDCINQAENAAQENERGEHDLYAQKTMALWTAIMGGVAVVGVGLSLVGVYLIYTTFKESRRAADYAGRMAFDTSTATTLAVESNMIAKDASERQLRAYVFVNEVWIAPVVEDGVEFDRILIVLNNGGQSPALLNSILVMAFWVGGDKMELLLKNTIDLSMSAPPNSKPVRVPTPKFDVDAFELTEQFSGSAKPFVFIKGVVDYNDVFGITRTTEFSYITDSDFWEGYDGDYECKPNAQENRIN